MERRRHWSDEEKLAILKETTQPGAIMTGARAGIYRAVDAAAA
ncbi:transposase [Novosphingobium sp. PhB165]|nr:transposase [Novosphingobium sp. PhB165]TCM13022.1 transposase [Novosphingobium sp. PhB165]